MTCRATSLESITHQFILRLKFNPSGMSYPVHGRQIPAKAASGRSLFNANQTGVFRGLLSLYSLKLVSGTRQRYCGLSQARQNGEETLRTLVPGWLPIFGGAGNPQRICRRLRSPSLGRTIGVIWSGKMASRGGTLPALSRLTSIKTEIVKVRGDFLRTYEAEPRLAASAMELVGGIYSQVKARLKFFEHNGHSGAVRRGSTAS